jgi:hypothetical protein
MIQHLQRKTIKTNSAEGNYKKIQHTNTPNLQRLNMLKVLEVFSVYVCGLLFSIVEAGRGEIFETNIAEGSGRKNYTEQEEDKLVPHRTFLTTVEITLICVFTVIFVFLMIGLAIYVYKYGWTIPACCKKQNKDYSQVQLQRERKISEIWKNHPNSNRN